MLIIIHLLPMLAASGLLAGVGLAMFEGKETLAAGTQNLNSAGAFSRGGVMACAYHPGGRRSSAESTNR